MVKIKHFNNKNNKNNEIGIFKQDSLFMPHTNQDRTRAFIYITLIGTIVSAVYTQMLVPAFLWFLIIALTYPILANGLTWLAKDKWKHSISIGLVWFDAFFIGCSMVILHGTPMISILLLIMANACFVLLGSFIHYLFSILFWNCFYYYNLN